MSNVLAVHFKKCYEESNAIYIYAKVMSKCNAIRRDLLL